MVDEKEKQIESLTVELNSVESAIDKAWSQLEVDKLEDRRQELLGKIRQLQQGKRMKTKSKPKTRVWSPKCRAATMADRRTKRNRTRGDSNRNAIREQE